MSWSERRRASLVAGCLLVSQLAFADGPSTPMPHPAAAPLEAAAPVVNAHCVPAWVIDAAGIRQLPDRCVENDATTEVAVPGCEQPFWIDQQGIKRLKIQCLESSPRAAPVSALPYVTPVPSSDRKQTVDCTNPFWVDQHGLKRLKMQCL